MHQKFGYKRKGYKGHVMTASTGRRRRRQRRRKLHLNIEICNVLVAVAIHSVSSLITEG